MLEAKLNCALVLRRVFDCIREIISDGNIDVDSGGISLQALDGNHVALVHLRLLENGFTHFRCDRPRALGINVASVTKAFKSCGNHDSVLIQNEDDKDIITFIFENQVDDRVSTFSLKLMSIVQDALSIPENVDGFDAQVTISSKEFANICRQMNEFSDTVKIEIDPTGIKFSTQGDVGYGEVLLRPREPTSDSDMGVKIKARAPIKQSYATKYLNIFAKSGCLSDAISFGLSRNRPIEIRFEIKDGVVADDVRSIGNKLGELKFYLAPKLDDEGEE